MLTGNVYETTKVFSCIRILYAIKTMITKAVLVFL